MIDKKNFREKYPTMRMIQLRLQPDAEVDPGESPHIAHIRECVELIEEVEADKKGTSDEKVLDMNLKYKLALQYM